MSFTKRLIVLLLSGQTLLAYADETAIEHTIVSGTRSQQPSVEIPASIQILTAEQIKLSGAQNLVQVLNAQAGIQINDNVGNLSRGASISMRGFGDNTANNVLVMVDGRKINNPTLATPDLASISLKDVERVEIIQGSAGTLYGDQATGGVINIITRSAAAFSAYSETTRGTDDLEAYRGSISQKFDNGLSYRLSGEKKLADNYRDNNEASYSNLFTTLAYHASDFSLFVDFTTVDDKLRLPGSLSSSALATDRKQTFSPDAFSNLDTESYRLGGSYNLSEQWTLLAEYADSEAEGTGFLFGNPFSQETKASSFEPRLAGDIASKHGSILITAGIDLGEDEYVRGFTDVDQENQDIYLQVIYPLSEQLKLTVGARQSDFEFNNNVSAVNFDDDITVFQAGLAYQIQPNSRIFLRLDEGFRWANIDENGFIPPTLDFLLPQETESWELGAETRIERIFLSALVYQLQAENEIVYDPTADGPFGPGANVNVDQSERSGIVLNAIWDISEQLNLQLNYSYVDAELSAGTYDGKTAPFVAESTANLVISYQLMPSWSLYFDAQYTGERFLAGDQGNAGEKVPAFTVYNASVRWEHQQYYAQLRANNLSGKLYNGFSGGGAGFDYNYPAPEETYQLTLGYNF